MSLEFSLFEDKISTYIEILLKWNKIHNLSGRLDLLRAKEYVRQSIYPLKIVHDFRICIDIGSGAGFPGIPLAISRPKSHFVLIEINHKKAAFLKYICATLRIENAEIINADFKSVNKRCELLTSRALMKTSELIKNASHLLGDRGHFLLYKGSQAEIELENIDAQSRVKIIKSQILKDSSLMNYCYIDLKNTDKI